MTKPARTPKTVEELVHIAKWLAFKAWKKTVASRGVYLAPAREDLEGAALLGLAQAIHRFDPGRGLELATFASPRIRGAIQDEIRKSDMLGRTFRDYEKNAYAPKKPRTAQVNKAKFVLVPLDERIALGLVDPGSDSITKLQQEEQCNRIRKYLDELRPLHREALFKYFWEGKTLKTIATETGYCKTTVAKTLRKGCEALHRLIRQDLYKGEK